MRRAQYRIALFLLAATVAGCSREPHALLIILDPDNLAPNPARIAVGTNQHKLRKVKPASRSYPISLTIAGKRRGPATLFVEARNQSGAAMAGARLDVRFIRRKAVRFRVTLSAICGVAATGTSCVLPDQPGESAICLGGECVISVCGDAYTDANRGEQCDMGLLNDDSVPDRCRSDCRAASCGDGIIDSGEGCDDGNEIDEDDCLSPNSATPCMANSCGDGIQNKAIGSLTAEACDDGNLLDEDECLSSCQLNQCGDGIRNLLTTSPVFEPCDDGDNNPNDGCAACRLTTWTPTVVAGKGRSGGTASLISLTAPRGVATDRSGSVYIADTAGNRIVIVTPDGNGASIAGNGELATAGDGGPAGASSVETPQDVATDGLGNVFIATANCVRVVDSLTQTIETFAGSCSQPGLSGDNGVAPLARLDRPLALAVDGAGNLYVADTGNSLVRRIDVSTRIITTAAGGGALDPRTDAPLAPLDSLLEDVYGLEVSADGQDLYVLDKRTVLNGLVADYALWVWHIDLAQQIMAVVDGTPLLGSTAARLIDAGCDAGPNPILSYPSGLALTNTGNLLLASPHQHLVHLIDLTTGAVSPYAGGGLCDGSSLNDGDGALATAACLAAPSGVAVDPDGAILIADTNHDRVRSVDAAGMIAHFAGGKGDSENPAGRLATTFDPKSSFMGNALAADFLGDIVYATNTGRVVRLDVATGLLELLAGNGAHCTSAISLSQCGDDLPAKEVALCGPGNPVILSTGAILFSENACGRVRLLLPTADGYSISTFAQEETVDSSSNFMNIVGLAADTDDTLYLGSDDGVWRLEAAVAPTLIAGTGLIPTGGCDPTLPCGDGGPAVGAELSLEGIAVGSGTIYVYETQRYRIRAISGGQINTVVGSGVRCTSGQSVCADDKPALQVQLRSLSGMLAVDEAGRLYFDLASNMIFRVDNTQTVRRIAGNGILGRFPPAGDGEPASDIYFGMGIQGLTAHDGVVDSSLYSTISLIPGIASTFNIRRVDLASGLTRTMVGTVDPVGDGPLAVSSLQSPTEMQAANLFGSEHWLVADRVAGRVRAVVPTESRLRSLVGYEQGMSGDGVKARFSRKLLEPSGLAFSATQNRLFISETGGHCIRVVNTAPADWTISDFAGLCGTAGTANGNRVDARFSSPTGLSLSADGAFLFAADTGNHVVRCIDLSTDTVSTVAGVVGIRGRYGDGLSGAEALFNEPRAVVVGVGSYLYIADTGNDRVRLLSPDGNGAISAAGIVSIVTGEGVGGNGTQARFASTSAPAGLALDSLGNLFVTTRTALVAVDAGDDDVATGVDPMSVIYGSRPLDNFPESLTNCLTGVELLPGDDSLILSDSCLGYIIRLDRGPL